MITAYKWGEAMDMMLGFLGQYISAAELGDKSPTLTIASVALEKVEQLKDDGMASAAKVRDRVVIYFSESKSGRGWLLNRTNAEALKELWGRETDNWIGHKVTIHAQMVRVGAKTEPGIRVKGSPELSAPRTFSLKLPRKRPQDYRLVPTGTGGEKKPLYDTESAEFLLETMSAAERDAWLRDEKARMKWADADPIYVALRNVADEMAKKEATPKKREPMNAVPGKAATQESLAAAGFDGKNPAPFDDDLEVIE